MAAVKNFFGYSMEQVKMYIIQLIFIKDNSQDIKPWF